MNKILIIFFYLILSSQVFADRKLVSDTLTFDVQRERVNKLLNERSAKFADYDFSLQQKSGFFGLLKSHNDFQRSMKILEEIIVNDNHIFIETRKLIDLKDSERERFQVLAQEYDKQITAHMNTISKLQKENERLREVIADLENKEHNAHMVAYVLLVISFIAGIAYLIYYRYSKN